jgi:hypothetical protein
MLFNFKLVCRKHTSAGMVYMNNAHDLKNLEKALILYKKKAEAKPDENAIIMEEK